MSVVKKKITVFECHCVRCGFIWTTRQEGKLPAQCPKCHSYKWNVPRKGITEVKNK